MNLMIQPNQVCFNSLNFIIIARNFYRTAVVVKTKFYIGESTPEYAAGCYFGVFQGFNLFVIYHSAILIFKLNIYDSFIYVERNIHMFDAC